MIHLDHVEESARRIGAVNTIANEGGRLTGHNTDWRGLVFGLREGLEIKGNEFAILGAGGTARAAAFGILKEGGVPMILNRGVERGEALARELGCQFLPLSEIGKVEADCLINATPVGMAPNTDEIPVPRACLGRFPWVMDIIYNPLKTRLLREAEKAGCRVLHGVGMFVHQGAEQIRIWTGMEPPRAQMKEVVLKVLRRDHGD
jgi:shikimate dehydrogenase